MKIVLLKHFPDFLIKKKKKIPHFYPSTRFYRLPYFSLMLLCTGQENLGEGSELFKFWYFIILRQGAFIYPVANAWTHSEYMEMSVAIR